ALVEKENHTKRKNCQQALNDFPYFFLIPSLLPDCFSTTGFMRGRAVTLPLQVRLWLKLSMALQGKLLTRSPCRFLSKTLFTLEAGI
ncbi:MAG: hypothetical protein OXE85_12825, partial [Roseovarius sp.]|nr:hypothetical protein [Roseovarius sp.]